jgi:hypothetical protein
LFLIKRNGGNIKLRWAKRRERVPS